MLTQIARDARNSSVHDVPQVEGVRPARSLFLPVAVGLLAVGLGLRLFRITHESLWVDEGYTLLFSHLPIPRLISVGGAHEHPPFFYLLVHLGLSIKDSYLVPRLISAMAGAASVVALYALGKRLYDAPTGLVAALLLAVSPLHIWFSQDGRAYELAGLLVVLSYLSLASALDRPARVWWLAYVLCLVLALYTEYTTALALAPQVLLLARARDEHGTSALLRSWLAAGLLLVPWAGVFILNTVSVVGGYWIPGVSWDEVVTTVLEFLGFSVPCPDWPCAGFESPFPLVFGHESLVTAIAIAGILALPVVAARRRDLVLGALSLWLILPFAVVFALMPWRSLYLDRVFLASTFPLYLLLGLAVTRVMHTWTWRALPFVPVVLVVLAASLSTLHPLYAGATNPDWSSPARDLARAYRPGQRVVYAPGVLQTIVTAYLPGDEDPMRAYPVWYHAYLDVPGWTERYRAAVRAERDRFRRDRARGHPRRTSDSYVDGRLRDMELHAATDGERQVWLVVQDYAGTTDTRTWFRTHGFHLLLSQIYPGDTRLDLWDRRAPASSRICLSISMCGTSMPISLRGHTPWPPRDRAAPAQPTLPARLGPV